MDYHDIELNKKYFIGIRSEDFYIDPSSKLELLFTNVEYMGSDIYGYADAEESANHIIMRFKPEDEITTHKMSSVGIDMEKLYVFDKKTEKTLIFPKLS